MLVSLRCRAEDFVAVLAFMNVLGGIMRCEIVGGFEGNRAVRTLEFVVQGRMVLESSMACKVIAAIIAGKVVIEIDVTVPLALTRKFLAAVRTSEAVDTFVVLIQAERVRKQSRTIPTDRGLCMAGTAAVGFNCRASRELFLAVVAGIHCHLVPVLAGQQKSSISN